MCKPCARRARRRRIRENRKARGKVSNFVEQKKEAKKVLTAYENPTKSK
jgi:hypothetical protein